jgi:ERCC4-related helicase
LTFAEGQRVKHRRNAKIGTVVGTTKYGAMRYRVAFPEGEWEVPPADLLAVFTDPFELLEHPPRLRPYDGWLRREALRLLDAYRNDPTAALSNSRIEPQHHQISVAMRALEKSQPRLILADEVGLGKTIEAGLVLKELRARGVLDRVLILTPASLMTQWQTELRSKFNELFITHDGVKLRDLREQYPDANPWNIGDQANVIASMQFARMDAQRELIASAHWDLVIVDEAHHARRRWDDGPNLAYQLLESLRDRVGGLLLLTATPMQLETYELYSMVELVEPGLFDDFWDFEDARTEIAEVNEQIAWLQVGPGTDLQEIVLQINLEGWGAPPEVCAADTSDVSGRAFVCQWLESRHRLADALVRNRKAQVGGFMKRSARRITVQPTQEELDLESDVQAYLRREYARSPAFGLVLVTFQKLLASSSRALALALERRAMHLQEKEDEALELTDDLELAEELSALINSRSGLKSAGEIIELLELAERARAIEDTKLDALDLELDSLFAEQPDQKVLIFTQYLGTLEMIRERLAPKLRVNVFHGGLDRREKEVAHQAFKNFGQVLISTEAGGEGRNFQFCHILFNYDLPWNPMRIEQRIGRLDRVGQKHNVLIYNFGVTDTLDERILDVLEYRIQIFTESVGALEPILGDIEERIKKICLADAVNARQQFEQYEVTLEQRISRARAREAQMGDFIMDARSFRRDEVSDLLGRERMAGPEDLQRFVLAAIARYPTARVTDEDDGVYRVELPGVLLKQESTLRDEYRGTFDYRVALEDEGLEFFAFGHPLVEAIVTSVSEEGSVPPLAMLAPEDETDGVLIDYEVRFTGVRDRLELLSHVVNGGVHARCPRLALPEDPSEEVQPNAYHPSAVAELAGESHTSAAGELERRFTLFRVDNEQTYQAERQRLEKLFAFQSRHFEQRIARIENQIDRLDRFGTDSERRVIPALRGRIAQDHIRLRAVDEERDDALARLSTLRQPSEEIRVVGATLLTRSPDRLASDLGDRAGLSGETGVAPAPESEPATPSLGGG